MGITMHRSNFGPGICLDAKKREVKLLIEYNESADLSFSSDKLPIHTRSLASGSMCSVTRVPWKGFYLCISSSQKRLVLRRCSTCAKYASTPCHSQGPQEFMANKITVGPVSADEIDGLVFNSPRIFLTAELTSKHTVIQTSLLP